MNERIKELAKQAGLDDADFPIENWDNVPLAKFAELIVKECVDELMSLHKRGVYSGMIIRHNYFQYAANMLKEHFGVEE